MEPGQQKPSSEAVTVFHGCPLPETAIPVSYAALINAYDLAVPVPIRLAAIGPRDKTYTAHGWELYTPRHKPEVSLGGHLTFALRYEGIDLAALKRLFLATGPDPITALVRGLQPERTRGEYGSYTNGCLDSGLIYLTQLWAAMPLSSTRTSNGR